MSKYRAKPQVINGIRFASQKEGKRYLELRLLERAGQIRGLTLQVPLALSAGNDKRTSIGKYVADFVYEEFVEDHWRRVVEDVKGFKTPLYRWKKKHVEIQYGIQIREI
jgi:hypothetical protein